MEYVYAALLLHKLGKQIDEESIKRIMQAAGAEIDETKIKTLIASLKGVDVTKILEEATIIPTTTTAPAAEEKKEKPEEKKEAAAEGLSALFG